MKTKAAIVAIVAVAVGIGALVVLIDGSGPKAIQQPSPGTAGRDVSAVPSVDIMREPGGFAGNSACLHCHEEIGTAWQQNGMSQSWRDAQATEHIRGALSDQVVVDPNGPYRYRVHLEGQQVTQTESSEEANSASPHSLSFPARYFVGSGKHALAMVTDDNGYLKQLPVAWYASPGHWGLNPGYEVRNRRFDRPVLPGCVACHGGRAVQVQPTRNRYATPVQSGIACEHCHGPGKTHAADPQADGAILNPRDFDADAANDMCLECHLQGDIVVDLTGGDGFSDNEPRRFRPGERLTRYRLDFLIRGPGRPVESFGVASHGARLLQSRCYLDSQPALTCIRCHDPHVSVDSVSHTEFDQQCIDCHQTNTCTLPVSARPSADSGCVSCHMPQRPAREGQHLVFTDHWIRIPETESPIVMTAERIDLAADESVELVPIRPASDPLRVRLGEAYVRLSEAMGPHRPSLDRAAELLQSALQNDPHDASASYWLAAAETGRQNTASAIRLLTALRDAHPDNPRIHFRLGIAYDQMGDYALAVSSYELAVELGPHWMEPYPLLARLYLFQGRAASAERLLRQQASFHASAQTWASLALARHLQSAPVNESLALTDRALALDPRSVPAWLNRGVLLTADGDTAAAKQCFERALAIDPQNVKARELRRSIDN